MSEPKLRGELERRGLRRTAAQRQTIINEKHSQQARRRRESLPVSDVIQRYESGESQNSIATSLGVSRRLLERLLDDHDVPIRRQDEANQMAGQRLTDIQRQRQGQRTSALFAGGQQTWEHRCKIAVAHELRGKMGDLEATLCGYLRDRGYASVPQKAVGPYNVDLAIGKTAIEVFGGHWHGGGRHKERSMARYAYLLACGWNVVIVWCNRQRFPLAEPSADYLVEFLEQYPDQHPEHQIRVIWGDGREAAVNPSVEELSNVPRRGRSAG